MWTLQRRSVALITSVSFRSARACFMWLSCWMRRSGRLSVLVMCLSNSPDARGRGKKETDRHTNTDCTKAANANFQPWATCCCHGELPHCVATAITYFSCANSLSVFPTTPPPPISTPPSSFFSLQPHSLASTNGFTARQHLPHTTCVAMAAFPLPRQPDAFKVAGPEKIYIYHGQTIIGAKKTQQHHLRFFSQEGRK